MYDVIIVGAGPAGMSAALYCLRANKNVLLLEKNMYGGQIVNAHRICNYPGIKEIDGFTFSKNLYEQVVELGGAIKYEEVINISSDLIVTTNKGKYQSKSIIIATGVTHNKLNVLSEKDFIGKGVSYCATCDGAFYKDKDVAVIGGGNTALCDAIYLSDICKNVYLIHRRDTFRGDKKYVDLLKTKNNVHFILNSTISQIIGNDYASAIELEPTKEVINVEGLFVAIGHVPNNDFFKNVVDLDEHGYIITSDSTHTKTPFIYAVGDARSNSVKQLITACSNGVVAALQAIKEVD